MTVDADEEMSATHPGKGARMTEVSQQVGGGPIGGEVESHSIDIIPDDERGGKVSGQFTLWFATNANVFNFVLGGFAILFGLNVFWALIAMFLGAFLGLAFTSLHAVQGPRVVEFGADKNGSDFVGHGGDGLVHAQPVVFRPVSITQYKRLVCADRTAGRGRAAADMACVSGDFDL